MRKEISMSKKMNNKKSKKRIDESEITPTQEEIYAGCEKWFKIIHSLHLPIEVLRDRAKVVLWHVGI